MSGTAELGKERGQEGVGMFDILRNLKKKYTDIIRIPAWSLVIREENSIT